MTSKSASVVYIDRKDKTILCVWNKRFGGWCLPGGKQEPGEEGFQTASRELLEETGLICDKFKMMYSGPGTVDPDFLVTVWEPSSKPSIQRDMSHVAGGGVHLKSIFDFLQGEPGCPVAWMPRDALTAKGNPFGTFYEEFFKKMDEAWVYLKRDKGPIEKAERDVIEKARAFARRNKEQDPKSHEQGDLEDAVEKLEAEYNF
jgi:8-oxo-dGTP pyrophosphatase MutT (NUDIX family)